MVQSKNRKLGGMAKASSSVLKLVSTIHRIGKKMMKPTVQAAAVLTILRWVETWRAMSGLQIPADDADQEECQDIGDDHGDQTTGRGTADVILDERLGIDQEGDVGGLQTWAAAGGHKDLGKDGEQEDGLD